MNILAVGNSRLFRIMIVVMCVVTVKYHRIWADQDPLPWFQQLIDIDNLKGWLKNESYKIRINETLHDKSVRDGLTGLMYAVDFGNRDAADEFIKAGADLNIRADNALTAGDIKTTGGNERYFGTTALHLAILNCDDPKGMAIVEDLIKGIKKDDGTMSAKSDVMMKNGKGFTALHAAVAAIEAPDRSWQVVEWLIEAAGNKEGRIGFLNAQDSEGNTALHIMAATNKVILASKIIEKYGRDLKIDIRNNPIHGAKEGQIPKDLADDAGYGTAMGEKLRVELERYNDSTLSEENYRLHPTFEDIPSRNAN